MKQVSDKERTKWTKRIWLAFPVAIAAGVMNVALFFLFMVLYSYVIDPGNNDAYYQEAASRFGPYASIVAGIPVMFAAGRYVRWAAPKNSVIIAVAAWTVYFALDAAVLAAAGALLSYLPHVIVSFSTKFAAIFYGARQPDRIAGGI